MDAAMIGRILLLSPVLLVLVYPLYVLLMAVVLRAVGVERQKIAKWALRQADRQRFTDLIRAVRGVHPQDAELAGSRPASHARDER